MVRVGKTYMANEWLSFNKKGVGSVPIFAKTKSAALKQARIIFGKGASVEFYKKTKLTKVHL